MVRARLVIAFNAENSSRPALSPRLKRLMLEDRDEFVMSELGPLIEKNPTVRRMVIFYGFQHLAGMERRLEARGYLPTGPIEWENAMTVHPVAEGIEEGELDGILKAAGSSGKLQSP
jgi:hypothetical protein